MREELHGGLPMLADLDPEQAGNAASLLRALANPTRLMLLCSLVEGEHSVSELNQRIPLSQSALSQHLARLREEHLVATRRESQTIYYRIADPVVLELIAPLHRRFCTPGDGPNRS
ncbi:MULTISPECIES: metalloregulator ArsR/SmtB family transcription factor [unclassified Wenzhouxiangella]|uniref:ArsR/SmtB family transcription factor n=1 Tax=unclassified Wenzhouxiangella TaxID=2613841 RepID=UPI002163463E|nr:MULTISPECIES: metalloregulator ArsR/SmtB family transcription factor [unclassified Wenzhouxiangella]